MAEVNSVQIKLLPQSIFNYAILRPAYVFLFDPYLKR